MGDMADYFAGIGWENICDGYDDGFMGHSTYIPRTRLSKEEWVKRQRGDPRKAFLDGYVDENIVGGTNVERRSTPRTIQRRRAHALHHTDNTDTGGAIVAEGEILCEKSTTTSQE